MTHYILQTIVFQLLFLLVYDFFLKNETFFKYNRAYLLLAPTISVLLPFVEINGLQETIPLAYRVQLPAVMIGDVASVTNTVSSEMAQTTISGEELLRYGWFVGAAIAMGVFLWKVRSIVKLKRSASLHAIDGVFYWQVPRTDTAFTFLKIIFLGEKLSQAQKKDILIHERAHVNENHFIDLLIYEVFRIVFWFNPLVYLFQKRIALLHEYSADATVAKTKSRRDYYQDLLSQVFQVEHISFINTFFNHSLIRLNIFGLKLRFGTRDGQVKKRITMLQKSKSKKIVQLKYLVLLPIIAAMLVYTSCSNDKSEVEADLTTDTEVMDKINELSEAIMKKGNLSDEEARALKLLSTEAKPGDKVYTSVQEYLDDPQNKTIVETQELHEDPNSTSTAVPFAVLDRVPIFPGCENASGQAAKTCMAQKIQEFVGANFNAKIADDLSLSGKQRISVIFKISTNGTVQDIQARAPHIKLKEEAIRVISNLPRMLPGEHQGKKVNVLYNLPIIFEVNE